jgi:hypothetical protein
MNSKKNDERVLPEQDLALSNKRNNVMKPAKMSWFDFAIQTANYVA